MDAIRERVVYGYGFFHGRVSALPGSLSDLYGFLAAKGASLISLPLPFLSFLAIPFYGGSSTTLSLVSFYIAWAALVFTHDPLKLELYGTLVLRLLCFLVPALGSLAFDCAVPRASKAIKSRGERQLPGQLGMNKLLKVVGIAVFNVLLAVVFQTTLELVTTRILLLRSLVKVSTTVPLPLTIFKQVVYGLVLRGISHYAIHRYALHTWNSSLKTWHLSWQHSIIPLPFSLVAAYDHPINYLLSSWVPTILPAYLFRWHVLTWHIFLALCSLEELFVFSGYSVLPSTIILAGMARRTDVHFDSVQKGQTPGNFGHLGVLDFLLGTQSKEGSTVVDDIQDEAAKRRFHEQVEEAVHAVMKKSTQTDDDKDQDGEEEEAVEDDDEKPFQKVTEKKSRPLTDEDQAEGAEQSDNVPVPRRSGRGRKKGRG